jgi:hypothetical protein
MSVANFRKYAREYEDTMLLEEEAWALAFNSLEHLRYFIVHKCHLKEGIGIIYPPEEGCEDCKTHPPKHMLTIFYVMK